MRVFVTGATGYIGSAVVEDLIRAGHMVLGLARNDVAADALKRMRAEVHRGDLSDPKGLSLAALECDGVIHTAYNHDFSQFAAAAEMDRRVVEAFGEALSGTGMPLVIASAIGLLSPGRPTTEDDTGDPRSLGAARIPSEELALALASENVRSNIIRLPPVVHDRTKQGLVTRMIALANQTGASAYVRGGLNRWPAVHRRDAAQLFRLALEKGASGSRYHAIAEDGIALRAIAEAVGRLANVRAVSKTPEEAASHFGFLAYFVSADFQASSTKTKQALGWNPTGPGLIADLEPA
ncbi:MAG: SDR family oxidoreductase [Edaphobacter sp.]|uniref:SDR family oxidoreductase n=1 Tax=Edaphobacter sp. TaxID=1934404 RepID=UPI0023A15FEF|nr:SDR family oxidoreductase [Edaphobacter sp.]MDE1177111.1 SDR family oxidoreductase [Edaphobacter sp.]